MLYLLTFALLLYWAPNPTQGQEFWLNFTITEVLQCSPVAINFSSNVSEMDSPITLTILPFSDEPIIIPIETVPLNASGLSISFLPLRADQEFIASLDDSVGQSVAQISDVTRVLPSPTGDSSCFISSGLALNSKEDEYKVLTTPVQCQDITLSYNTKYVKSAPTVRAFAPNGDSALLPRTSDDPANGTATYTMVMQRGMQVLLMIDDGLQHRETTDLLTVAGDSDSPKDCLNRGQSTGTQGTTFTGNVTGNPQDNSQGPTEISQEVIIGCSAGGAVILIIAISMVVFVIRDRKLRRQKHISSFFNSPPTPAPEEPPPKPPKDTKSILYVPPQEGTTRNPFEESPRIERGAVGGGGKRGGFIMNPPYVMGELKGANDGKVSLAGRSFSSWTNDDEPSIREASMHRRPSVDPVQVLDIEGMLNMATALSGTQIMKHTMGSEDDTPQSLHSAKDSQSTVKSLGIPYPQVTNISTQARTRHSREPSDVPADLTGSGTLSAISMVMPNPFSDDTNVELPSPFNRTDEPARPASDIVRPISIEEKEEEKATDREELEEDKNEESKSDRNRVS